MLPWTDMAEGNERCRTTCPCASGRYIEARELEREAGIWFEPETIYRLKSIYPRCAGESLGHRTCALHGRRALSPTLGIAKGVAARPGSSACSRKVGTRAS